MADAKVGRHPRIRIAERAHRDVLGGPRADAGQREQLLPGLAAALEPQPVGECLRDRGDRAPAGARHRQRRRHRDDRLRLRPYVRQPTNRLRERLSRRRDEPRRQRARGCERDLLAEDGADRQLSPVHRARHPQPGAARHERAEERIAAEVGVRGGGIGAEDRSRGSGGEVDHAPTGDRAAIDAVDHLLDAGHRARGEERD